MSLVGSESFVSSKVSLLSGFSVIGLVYIDMEELAIKVIAGVGVAGALAIVGFVGGIYFKAGKVVEQLRAARTENGMLRGELHTFAGKVETKLDSLAILLSGVETRVSVLEAVVKIKGGENGKSSSNGN